MCSPGFDFSIDVDEQLAVRPIISQKIEVKKIDISKWRKWIELSL